MSIPRIYWDSCVWIGLINGESDKFPGCQYSLELAQKGEIYILSSHFTLVEVYKTRCNEPYKMLAEEKDIIFEEYFMNSFILQAQVDRKIATLSRELLRYNNPPLKKAADAIHLATAIQYNAESLYTFDNADLMPLNNKLRNANGGLLQICTPPPPPANWKYNSSLIDQIVASNAESV